MRRQSIKPRATQRRANPGLLASVEQKWPILSVPRNKLRWCFRDFFRAKPGSCVELQFREIKKWIDRPLRAGSHHESNADSAAKSARLTGTDRKECLGEYKSQPDSGETPHMAKMTISKKEEEVLLPMGQKKPLLHRYLASSRSADEEFVPND